MSVATLRFWKNHAKCKCLHYIQHYYNINFYNFLCIWRLICYCMAIIVFHVVLLSVSFGISKLFINKTHSSFVTITIFLIFRHCSNCAMATRDAENPVFMVTHRAKPGYRSNALSFKSKPKFKKSIENKC